MKFKKLLACLLLSLSVFLSSCDLVDIINHIVEDISELEDEEDNDEETTLEEEKIASKTVLDSYLTISDYRPAQVTEINNIINNAKTNIDACTTVVDVTALVISTKALLDDVKTDAELIAEENAALASAKLAAKTEIYSYLNFNDYRVAQISQINNIISQYNSLIEAATTQVQITGIVNNCKEELDEVKTSTEMDAIDLANYKTSKIASLNSISLDIYRDNEKTIVQGYITTAITEINAATSIDAVDSKYNQYVTLIDAVDTDAELTAADLESSKTNAKSTLDNYVVLANYRTAQQTTIQGIITNGKAAIDAVTVIDNIATTLQSYKDQIDAVKTDLALSKEEACANLDNVVTLSNYGTAQQNKLTSLISEGKTAINACTAIANISTTYASYDTALKAVPTSQEIATAKTTIANYVTITDYTVAQQESINTLITAFNNKVDTELTKTAVEDDIEYYKDEIDEVTGTATPTYNVADYYDGYYTALVSWTDSDDLIQQLHDIISGGTYNPVAYNGNWESNQYADTSLYDYDYVDVVYDSDPILRNWTYMSAVAGSAGFQREHAFCASLMTGVNTGLATSKLGRATDFHNLFAAGKGNTYRGNKYLGNVDPTDDGYLLGSSEDPSYDFESSTTTFEPSDYDKGRLARAIFYMTVMYNEDVYEDFGKYTYTDKFTVSNNQCTVYTPVVSITSIYALDDSNNTLYKIFPLENNSNNGVFYECDLSTGVISFTAKGSGYSVPSKVNVTATVDNQIQKEGKLEVTDDAVAYDNNGKIISDHLVKTNTAYTRYAMANYSDLIEWADPEQYPVDELEYQHNVSVYSQVISGNHAQGNRNPFVDYPELIYYIANDQPGELKYLEPTYEALEIGEDKVRRICLGNDASTTTIKEYNVGSTFNKSDIVLFAVGKDNVKTRISSDDFVISGITDGEVLNDLGTKTISVSYTDDDSQNHSLTYSVNVVNADPLESCDYRFDFCTKTSGSYDSSTSKSLFDGSTNKSGQTLSKTLGTMDWNFSYVYESDTFSSTESIKNDVKGLKFGTSSYYFSSITFTTTAVSNTQIDKIYFRANRATGTAPTIKIYVNNMSVPLYTSTTFNNEETTFICDVPSGVTGTVKIEITNPSAKSIYLKSIGFLYE